MKNFILTGRDDVKITGYEWNVENPEKIVCIIHGIGEYAKRFEEVADIFNRNKIAVFALDLRGHGKTDGVRGHTAPINMVLEDVDKLILYGEISGHKNLPVRTQHGWKYSVRLQK